MAEHAEIRRYQGLKLQLIQRAYGDAQEVEEILVSTSTTPFLDIGPDGHRGPTGLRRQAKSLVSREGGCQPLHHARQGS